jgi:hypothetical protein
VIPSAVCSLPGRRWTACSVRGYAAAHPGLVAAVMAAASSDYAVQLVARAIEHIAKALWSRRRLVPTRRGNDRRNRLGCGRLSAGLSAYVIRAWFGCDDIGVLAISHRR